MDSITTPTWHYATILDFLDHWQALLAGLIGFLAAIIVIVVTRNIERRKNSRELEALRKSLAFELRIIVMRAWGAYKLLTKQVQTPNVPVTFRTLENLTRVPVPVIYPANADKIGLLGSGAMEIVIIYSLIEVARDAVNSLNTHQIDGTITTATMEMLANAFLQPCKNAREVFPMLRTGDPSHEHIDDKFLKEVAEISI